MPIPLALLAAGAGATILAAGVDAWRKNELANQQQRELDTLKQQDLTPPSVKEALAASRMAQGANMPGYNSALQGLDQATAGNVRAAQQNARGGSLIGALQQTQFARNRALSNLANQNAQFQVGERRNTQQLLGVAGGYEARAKEQFDRNRAALRQAIIQNREGAIRDITGAVSGVGSSVAGIGANQMMIGTGSDTGGNQNNSGTGVSNQTIVPGVSSRNSMSASMMYDYDPYSIENPYLYRPNMPTSNFMMRRQNINLPSYFGQ